MRLFTVRPSITSPVKASVMGVSDVRGGDALPGVSVGERRLVGVAVLPLLVRGMRLAPQPASPSRAAPPAASTSRRVQFLCLASKLFTCLFIGAILSHSSESEPL